MFRITSLHCSFEHFDYLYVKCFFSLISNTWKNFVLYILFANMMYYHNVTVVDYYIPFLNVLESIVIRFVLIYLIIPCLMTLGYILHFFLKTRIPKAFLKILKHVFYRYITMLQCFVVTTCHPWYRVNYVCVYKDILELKTYCLCIKVYF